jgi:hypothetical protein
MADHAVRAAQNTRTVARLLIRADAYGGISPAVIQLHMDRGHTYIEALGRLVHQLVWGTEQLTKLDGWTRAAAIQVCRRLLGLRCSVPVGYLERVRVAGIHLRSLPRSPFKHL